MGSRPGPLRGHYELRTTTRMGVEFVSIWWCPADERPIQQMEVVPGRLPLLAAALRPYLSRQHHEDPDIDGAVVVPLQITKENR